MNRVMKVIAVITCIAVIPSIIGGLLGVNLTEGDFPIKLTEIFFIVFSLMLLGLYAFYKMDWLK
jgi:Mg2+ and Co2+ transporter CorA